MLTFRISRAYLIRLKRCWEVLPRSKVTRTPRTVWCVSSRMEAVEIKPYQKNSGITALFLLVVLSVQRQILRSSQVYSQNNDSDVPDMNISLTYNSVTEWMSTLIPIQLHWKAEIVIAEGCSGCLPVLDALGFTVYTV